MRKACEGNTTHCALRKQNGRSCMSSLLMRFSSLKSRRPGHSRMTEHASRERCPTEIMPISEQDSIGDEKNLAGKRRMTCSRYMNPTSPNGRGLWFPLIMSNHFLTSRCSTQRRSPIWAACKHAHTLVCDLTPQFFPKAG